MSRQQADQEPREPQDHQEQSHDSHKSSMGQQGTQRHDTQQQNREYSESGALRPWQDPALEPEKRVEALISRMTLREKCAQLYGIWVGASPVGGDVAPFQHDMSGGIELDELLPFGLGQLTRPFGSAPVDPAVGVVSLARTQRRIVAANRFGIPALAHEECLAGFTAWGATAYPVPLSWGATFNPELIQRMAGRIGESMRSVGVHQGLAPVLDVVRDQRWGRVEETIGEDPYLVGTIATAYIRGLEQAGIIATLKHFIGYSASKAGRNHAPVEMGPREFADVMVPPFEMAIRESGVRSVMHAYVDVDGIPAASNRELLTGLLRETWGFEGTVVADYFGVAFLKQMHAVAGNWGEAAAMALSAGVDVELPSVKTFGEPLATEVEKGRLEEAVIDRALRRALRQKLDLGLLEADWNPLPPGWSEAELSNPEAVRGRVTLDSAADRALAREIAEQAIVLLSNDGTLPLGGSASAGATTASQALDEPSQERTPRRSREQSLWESRKQSPDGTHEQTQNGPAGSTTPGSDAVPKRILVTGPTADEALCLLGCYSFPGHVGSLHPEVPIGIELPTVLEAIRAEFPDSQVSYARGVSISGFETDGIIGSESGSASGSETDGIAAAVVAARQADLVITVLGDRPGLFGRGTSGEGCDAPRMQLPGRQQELLEALLDSGTPVVTVLLEGRPYALGTAPERAAAIVAAFFPGEEGASAIAGVLSGRVSPSGRLPVSVPATPDSQPATYLGGNLAINPGASGLDQRPRFPFGHGLSYTRFSWSKLTVNGVEVASAVCADDVDTAANNTVSGSLPSDGSITVGLTVENTGSRAGVETVQLYLHDDVASVVRPLNRLIGYARVPLDAGQECPLTFEVPADVASFTGRGGARIVEPGRIQLRLGASSGNIRLTAEVEITGPTRVVDHTRRLHAPATLHADAVKTSKTPAASATLATSGTPETSGHALVSETFRGGVASTGA